MNFEQGIHSLETIGFNIFLSTKVKDLPPDLYTFSEEQKEKTLVLIGHGGKTLWDNIPDLKIENPIDTFSINQMKWFGDNVLKNNIEILFPDENQMLPLQKLGRYFNLSHQSPLGFDISHDYGLWFAFRGVFLTDGEVPPITRSKKTSPCESCTGKLCMTVSDIFNARMKCPIKSEHQYSLEQREYHKSVVLNLKNRF